MNLFELAKKIIKEEEEKKIAQNMKGKGFTYVVHKEGMPVQYAKTSKEASDIMDKDREKKSVIKSIDTFIHEQSKKIIKEEEQWMQGSVKSVGKLRSDLGLGKDKKIYQAGINKVVDYAKKDNANLKRIQLARTFAKRRGSSMSKEEKDFWKSVGSELGWKESKKYIKESLVTTELMGKTYQLDAKVLNNIMKKAIKAGQDSSNKVSIDNNNLTINAPEGYNGLYGYENIRVAQDRAFSITLYKVIKQEIERLKLKPIIKQECKKEKEKVMESDYFSKDILKVPDYSPSARELYDGNNAILFSYETPIAAVIDRKGYRTEGPFDKSTTMQIHKFFNKLGVSDVNIASIPQNSWRNIITITPPAIGKTLARESKKLINEAEEDYNKILVIFWGDHIFPEDYLTRCLFSKEDIQKMKKRKHQSEYESYGNPARYVFKMTKEEIKKLPKNHRNIRYSVLGV